MSSTPITDNLPPFVSCIAQNDSTAAHNALYDDILPLLSHLTNPLKNHFQHRFNKYINPSFSHYQPLQPIGKATFPTLGSKQPISPSFSPLNPTSTSDPTEAKKPVIENSQYFIPESVDPTTLSTRFKDLMAFVLGDIKNNTMDTLHPGFFAYIPNSAIPAAALAKFLTTSLNRFPSYNISSGALGDIEHFIILFFCSLFGYDTKKAGGTFLSGGSLSNSTALFTARRKSSPRNNNIHKLRVYTTSETHFSGLKAASFVGFKFSNIIFIPHNQEMQFSVPHLKKQIISDLHAGFIPCCIFTSMGSTNTGTIDDIGAIRSMLDELDPLFSKYKVSPCSIHVDGAYGGAFVLASSSLGGLGEEISQHSESPNAITADLASLIKKRSYLLHSLHLADSITIDHHKAFFFSSFGSSMVLVKDRNHLHHAFRTSFDTTSYLQAFDPNSPVYDINTSEFSFGPELSRPSRGLELYITLQLVGIKPFRIKMTERLEYTYWLYTSLQSSGYQLLHRPLTSIIVFRINLDQESKYYRKPSDPKIHFTLSDNNAYNTNLLNLINQYEETFCYSIELNTESTEKSDANLSTKEPEITENVREKVLWLRVCILGSSTLFGNLQTFFKNVCDARKKLSVELFEQYSING